MVYKSIISKKSGSFGRLIISASIFGLLTAGLIILWEPPAMAQTAYYLQDYHFRAGDGGTAAATVAEGVNKQWGSGSSINWYPGIINSTNIPITFPAGATSPNFSGSDTLGHNAGTSSSDGRISLDVGQASASSGRGGDIVTSLTDGQVISNARNNAGRYIFTAGDGNSSGAGGNISLTANEVTFGAYSAFFFTSGANGGGNSGGEVNFSVEKLNMGLGYGSLIFFEQTVNGGAVKSNIGDLWVTATSAISYSGTSARYNTIENITLRAGSKLTLYGKAGNAYNPDLLYEFDQTGNYTADGATITASGGVAKTYLNIQAGSITASSLDFQNIGTYQLSTQSVLRYILSINSDDTYNNPLRPDRLAGESSLGVLDIRGLDKNNITFAFNPVTLLDTRIGETFCLIQGKMSDGIYLLADNYGTFARNFGAQMYLFELDGSSGDMLLTYLGVDGGFTHYIKSYFEGHAAAVTTAVRGGQFISDSVIENAKASARLNMTTSSLTMGASSLKTKTGSQVDGDNYNAALSGAYLFELGPGRMLLGAFVEASKGKYDTYHTYNPEAPQENSGKANLFGGGAFLHYSFPIFGVDGFHVEASARAGKIDNKYDSVFGTAPTHYKSNNSYYGGHISLGKAFFLSDQDMLDIYVNGFYTAVEATGLKTSASEELEFDKVESVVSRLGARYTRSWNDWVQSYIGVAWEREFQGEVDGTYLAKRYNVGAELKGDSAFGEIGLSVKPLEIPLTLEANVFGKSGRQEGLGGALSFKYEY